MLDLILKLLTISGGFGPWTPLGRLIRDIHDAGYMYHVSKDLYSKREKCKFSVGNFRNEIMS